MADILSDVEKSLLIEQYGGEVDSQFAKEAIMRQYAKIRPVRGTQTITNNRVGRTTLQKLTGGERPEATQTNFGKVSVTVDTVILARDKRSMLNEFQTHFDARMELAQDHGKELGKFFDQAFIIQAMKGAYLPAPANLNGAIGAGKHVELSTAGDESDPDKLYNAIVGIIVQMEEEEIPANEVVVFVRPTQFKVLLDNNKLMSQDFSSGNGDFAKATIHTIYGARIEKSARIPSLAITGHYLSNPDNGNAYDVSADEAKAVAVLLHPKSLLAGETIPLTSNVFYSDIELSWFIDSYLAFGVSVNRPDCCGVVRKA